MRISDWSSDVCSSDLQLAPFWRGIAVQHGLAVHDARGIVAPGERRVGQQVDEAIADRLAFQMHDARPRGGKLVRQDTNAIAQIGGRVRHARAPTRAPLISAMISASSAAL